MGDFGKRKRWGQNRKGFQPPGQDQQQPGFPLREARLLDVQEHQGTVRLVLDSGDSFEMAASSVPEGIPSVGEMVSVPVLGEIRDAAERKRVARKIFAMLDRCLQPVARIQGKLEERGFRSETIQAVLEQMEDRGLYSDRNYAEAYCRDCLLSKAVGRRYLVSKLREKRVPVSLAQEVVTEILDRDQEIELAKRAARLRWKRMRGASDHKAIAKVVRYLMGRGFDVGLANSCARSEEPRSENNFEE
jgi:regulatory protein